MNDKPRKSRTAQIAAIAAAVTFLSVSLGVTSGPVSAQKKPVQNAKHAKTSKAHKGGKKSKKGSSSTTTTPPK